MGRGWAQGAAPFIPTPTPGPDLPYRPCSAHCPSSCWSTWTTRRTTRPGPMPAGRTSAWTSCPSSATTSTRRAVIQIRGLRTRPGCTSLALHNRACPHRAPVAWAAHARMHLRRTPDPARTHAPPPNTHQPLHAACARRSGLARPHSWPARQDAWIWSPPPPKTHTHHHRPCVRRLGPGPTTGPPTWRAASDPIWDARAGWAWA